jgi:subtilisin family serine protease
MNRRITLALLLILAFAFPGFAQVVANNYVVELDAAPALEGFRSGRHRTAARQFDAARNQVLASQTAVIRALQNRGGRVMHRFDSILNGVLVEIPDAKASELALLPGVKAVHPVQTVKATLDRALPLHRIPEAWNNLPGGPDTAGAGIKVGVIDSGVDVRHPGFQDDSRPVLDGFPKLGANNEEIDRPLTNSKVVVMRSYENLVDRFAGSRLTATDSLGHGTGVAFAAVGKRIDGPYGPISGVAPAAYLGVYRISATGGLTSSDAAIMAAIEDAVKDGMDVINLSFGGALTPDDWNDAALSRVADAGVIFVSSIGNQGPGYQSSAWPGNSRWAIGVGASGNDRQISTRAVVAAGDLSRVGYIGSNSVGAARATATLKDSADFQNELGCDPFPAGSMAGSIALILRGTCTFEIKLNNARAAGAIAGIIYNPTVSETNVIMSQVGNRLPAVWLNNAEGLALKSLIKENPDTIVTVDFTPPITPQRLAAFSSMGPNSGSLQIKPDLVAAGDYFVTAAPVSCCGAWGDDSGYALTTGFVAIQGTSFSGPVVAGAAAVLKQSRPGLTVGQYKSLLANGARALRIDAENRDAIPFEVGSGQLDLPRSQRANAAASPTSLSFGGGGQDRSAVKQLLEIANVGAEADIFSLTVEPIGDSVSPTLSAESISLDARASGQVEVAFSGQALRAGHHHGYVIVRGTKNDVELRIPYWYGVASKDPGSIAVIVDPPAVVAPAGRASLTFRVTDTSGQAIDGAQPEIEVVTDGGRVDSVDPDPRGSGLYRGTIRPGRTPGTYVFRIKAGSVAYLFAVSVE